MLDELVSCARTTYLFRARIGPLVSIKDNVQVVVVPGCGIALRVLAINRLEGVGCRQDFPLRNIDLAGRHHLPPHHLSACCAWLAPSTLLVLPVFKYGLVVHLLLLLLLGFRLSFEGSRGCLVGNRACCYVAFTVCLIESRVAAC